MSQPTSNSPTPFTNKRSTRVIAAILAAGASNRFNGIKALAKLGDQTLLAHQYDLLWQLEIPAFAILGAYQAQIVAHAAELKLPFAINSQWSQGQRQSVASAARGAPVDCDGLLLMTVDQVCLTADDVARMIVAFEDQPDTIVCAAYDGIRGIPAIFPQRSLNELAGEETDRGAQHLLRSCENVIAIDMPNAAVDVDTRQDLARITRERELHNAHN